MIMHYRAAREACENTEFEEAASQFTQSAFHDLADSEYPISEDGMSVDRLSLVFYQLLNAGLCYRLAGLSNVATARCRFGRDLAVEYRDHHATRDLERGIAWELVADFSILGEFDPPQDEPYSRAGIEYRDVGYARESSFPLVEQDVRFLDKLIETTGYEVEEYVEYAHVFTTRVQFKDAVFGDLIERVLDAGEWRP